MLAKIANLGGAPGRGRAARSRRMSRYRSGRRTALHPAGSRPDLLALPLYSAFGGAARGRHPGARIPRHRDPDRGSGTRAGCVHAADGDACPVLRRPAVELCGQDAARNIRDGRGGPVAAGDPHLPTVGAWRRQKCRPAARLGCPWFPTGRRLGPSSSALLQSGLGVGCDLSLGRDLGGRSVSRLA